MIFRRGLASAVTFSKPNPLVEPIQSKLSRLPNGLTISSVDLQGAVSQLVFAFRSGSRYQQYDEGGLAHLLRNAIGTDSDNYMGMRLLWEAAQSGVNLDSRVSKDLHCVQMTVGRTQAPVALSVLGEIVQPALKPWDILNVDQEMDSDLKHQTPQEIVFENLHRAAFRNGPLANPLLSAPFQIGDESNIGHKKLAAYVLSRWKAAETALIGINIDHGLLLEYATERVVVPDGSAPKADPSPFLGGDVRQHGRGQMAHVAVAGPGAALRDDKAVAVHAVLCFLVGEFGHFTNYTGIPQPGSVVHKAVHQASNHNPFYLGPVNISHSDSGLAGFYLVAEGTKIYPYVKAAVQALREMAKMVDAETVEIAKRALTVQMYQQAECSEQLALDHATQVLAKGSAQSPDDKVQAVQQVTPEDVKKAASQLVSKLAMSCYGQIHQVPYLDEI